MRRLVLSLVGAGALAVASAAQAGPTIITPNNPLNPVGTSFVSVPMIDGSITATFGHAGIPDGDFTDDFNFTVPVSGLGSGSVTTSVNVDYYHSTTDTDLLDVLINGVSATLTLEDANHVVCTDRSIGTCGAIEEWAASDVTIPAGMNTIEVSGLSRGNGSYGGQATFTPNQASVPEPATWAMMLMGFGAVGFSMRRRRTTALPQLA
jgi:hypothetical protein